MQMKTPSWKQESESRWEMPGKFANNCSFSNAGRLEIDRHYNGSGPKAFGGAENWPVVELEFQLQAGEDDKAKRLAAHLRNAVKEFLFQEAKR